MSKPNYSLVADKIELTIRQIRKVLGIYSDQQDFPKLKINQIQKDKIQSIVSNSGLNEQLIFSILGTTKSTIYNHKPIKNGKSRNHRNNRKKSTLSE